MTESIDPQTDAPASSPDALRDFVASIQHLPLFTGMAAQLVRSVEREDISTGELGRQIATDAALVAQLLRQVNSVYYGLSRRIGTIAEAITVLGLDQVRRIVTAAVLQRPLLAYLHDTETARTFWRHQLLCAALARHLQARKGAGGEAAYMAGLLHDVGRLVMVVRFPQEADDLLARGGDDGRSAIERERERFGFDHALVGAALLEHWDVPEAMVLSTGQHADETEPDDPMAASVWQANLFAHWLIDAGDEAPAYADASENAGYAQMLAAGVTAEVRQQILNEVAAFESGGGASDRG